jgi:hypothetical protein
LEVANGFSGRVCCCASKNKKLKNIKSNLRINIEILPTMSYEAAEEKGGAHCKIVADPLEF